jgi:hypothetical protein
MRRRQEYFKFKAEILRTAGFIFLSSSGIGFVELLKRDFSLNLGLTIWIILSILLVIAGLECLLRSLEILEDNSKWN